MAYKDQATFTVKYVKLYLILRFSGHFLLSTIAVLLCSYLTSLSDIFLYIFSFANCSSWHSTRLILTSLHGFKVFSPWPICIFLTYKISLFSAFKSLLNQGFWNFNANQGLVFWYSFNTVLDINVYKSLPAVQSSSVQSVYYFIVKTHRKNLLLSGCSS